MNKARDIIFGEIYFHFKYVSDSLKQMKEAAGVSPVGTRIPYILLLFVFKDRQVWGRGHSGLEE